jgi:formylmethanofuran dehydrogenase subunit B
MGKSSKNQLKREIIAIDVKQAKQSTLEDLSFQFNIERTREAITPAKAIVINKISDSTKEDELALKVEFSLLPSKTSFFKNKFGSVFSRTLA